MLNFTQSYQILLILPNGSDILFPVMTKASFYVICVARYWCMPGDYDIKMQMGCECFEKINFVDQIEPRNIFDDII